jgi:hypothetical protein
MEKQNLRLGDDGEIIGDLPVNWDDTPKKKKRTSRWWAVRRRVRFILLITPLIVVTVLLTMVFSGTIDLNQFEWFRKLCISTLGNNYLAFVVDSRSYSKMLALNADNGQQCVLIPKRNGIGAPTWSLNGKTLAFDSFPNQIHFVTHLTQR